MQFAIARQYTAGRLVRKKSTTQRNVKYREQFFRRAKKGNYCMNVLRNL